MSASWSTLAWPCNFNILWLSIFETKKDPTEVAALVCHSVGRNHRRSSFSRPANSARAASVVDDQRGAFHRLVSRLG